ncbi:MAG: argininosuccinate lyase [Gammaproteobacteria bacterium]|nr:argininosuccinate lyase [Gammaproteobacteria bacterium]|tara:strand:- start:38144 stop:39538 length:1395 start_codon:yes stop_codon:yes gene_type:complete
MKNKTWAGRFTRKINDDVLDFSQSLTIDIVLYEADIMTTLVHVEMLCKCGHIKKNEFTKIKSGLNKIRTLARKGELPWSIELEDVHMNIENSLVEQIGDVGKKIHLGRSRNDLVTTDMRIYLRELVDVMIFEVRNIQKTLATLALKYSNSIFPGYTHLQIAQPVTFGHHLMAWQAMISRDEIRLKNTREMINVLPLGSAALSGTSLKIDRKFVAKKLQFNSTSNNSMDAVSDRDYMIDLAYTNSMIMLHLSRISEELVLWMNPQFNLIDVDEGFCTGSSIMPQKKNPDVPELVRGKTGSVYGSLIGLLTVLKGLPLTYNRDLQEDKNLIFESVDTTISSIDIINKLIKTLKLNKKQALNLAESSFSTATDLAEYLSEKGVAFRDSHHIVGKIVKNCEKRSISMKDMTLKEFKTFSDLIEKDIYKKISVENSVTSRKNFGSTSPKNVEKIANLVLSGLSKTNTKI